MHFAHGHYGVIHFPKHGHHEHDVEARVGKRKVLRNRGYKRESARRDIVQALTRSCQHSKLWIDENEYAVRKLRGHSFSNDAAARTDVEYAKARLEGQACHKSIGAQ